MDTIQNRNCVTTVLRRPFNPRAKSLTRTLSMIEPTNFDIDPQRQIPCIDKRPVSNFTNKDEYLEAMVEDLCDWFNFLYKLEDDNEMTPLTFFHQLKDGVILNKHANVVHHLADNYLQNEKIISRNLPLKIGNKITKVPNKPPTYVNVDFTKNINAFHKRDNISNFIQWCRDFNIPPSLTFETDDLIMLKNPRNVVVCLLEIARIGGVFGIEVPDIIQLDEEINKELANDNHSLNTNELINEDIDFLINSKNNINRKFSDSNVTMRKKTNLPSRINTDKSYHHNSQLGLNDTSKSSQIDNLSKPLNIDNNDSSHHGFPLSYSGYFNYSNGKSDPSNMKIDNSDNESINSHGSQYLIPKYKTQRPVGRVKIYDCFDRTDFVREKKYREKCDMRSLDERVREILSECQCCETFPMKRISEGKYQWGDKKTLIFVRILRNHVMVRVGGGWDTLNNFLSKHDYCRKGKQNPNRYISVPQIRKALNPSITCPSNFKMNLQGGNSQNENQGINKRNGVMMNINLKDTSNETASNVSRSISLIYSASSQNLRSEFKYSADGDSLRIFDNDDNSTRPSQSVCISENIPTPGFSEINISDNSENKIIQSNRRLYKHYSKIPVLKKR